MPDPTDKPPFGGHEPPPPMPSSPMTPIVAGIAFALNLATVIALLADRCSLATILAILALIFGGATFVMLMRSGDPTDKPPFGGHEPPPRG